MDQLRKEVAFLGLHLHWSYEVLMNLEHAERRLWASEVRSLLESLKRDKRS